MTKVIIMGHGGYGTAMQRNLGMLLGELEDYFYVDFNEEDDISILRERIDAVLAQIGSDEQVLICCDVAGGTPFREAATLCTEHENYCCVAGVNTSAYSEISFNLELTASELADMAIETAKETIMRFPEA